jgi:hypothetical protein
MAGQETIHERRLWLKWGILSTAWLLCALLFVFVVVNEELSRRYYNTADPEAIPKLPRNQIRDFDYFRYDPEENLRLVYSIHFANLFTRNNNFGFFKTALHKVIEIQDLELKFYRYSSDKIKSTATPDISGVYEGVISDTTTLVDKMVHLSSNFVDGWHLNNIDLGNVSEVRVNNFNYTVFRDEELLFATQSRRATISHRYSHVVLHGRVKITTADGSTLESNHVLWDVKKGYFNVDGVYVLNRRGTITTGKGICVDTQLESLKGHYTQSERKWQKCIAGL